MKIIFKVMLVLVLMSSSLFTGYNFSNSVIEPIKTAEAATPTPLHPGGQYNYSATDKSGHKKYLHVGYGLIGKVNGTAVYGTYAEMFDLGTSFYMTQGDQVSSGYYMHNNSLLNEVMNSASFYIGPTSTTFYYSEEYVQYKAGSLLDSKKFFDEFMNVKTIKLSVASSSLWDGEIIFEQELYTAPNSDNSCSDSSNTATPTILFPGGHYNYTAMDKAGKKQSLNVAYGLLGKVYGTYVYGTYATLYNLGTPMYMNSGYQISPGYYMFNSDRITEVLNPVSFHIGGDPITFYYSDDYAQDKAGDLLDAKKFFDDFKDVKTIRIEVASSSLWDSPVTFTQQTYTPPSAGTGDCKDEPKEVVVKCSDGSLAVKKADGTYECASENKDKLPVLKCEDGSDAILIGGVYSCADTDPKTLTCPIGMTLELVSGGNPVKFKCDITVAPVCDDGTPAVLKGNFYICSIEKEGEVGGGTPSIIIEGGGGPLIEIPRFEYDHVNTDNTITIPQDTAPGDNLGEVKDNSTKSTLKGTVTNIPNNGIVYITGEGFQPNVLVQHNSDSGLLPSGTDETSSVSKFLKDNGDITAVINAIDLNKHDIEGKDINDFKNIYDKCNASVDGVECTSVNKNTGVADLNNFRVKNPGRYLLTVYLKTADGKNFTYYKVIDAREIGEYTGLPIQNRLTAMVENKSIKEKNANKSHQFADMKFTFGGSKESSLSAPSANNAITNKIVLGSTDKGVKMLNNDLTPLSLSGANMNNASITQVDEIRGTTQTLVSSSNEGIFLLDTKTGKSVKVTGLLSNNIQSFEMKGSVLYIAFDTAVGAYFVDSVNNAHLRDSITSQEIFGVNVKLGELNLMDSVILVNTHHSNTNNKMAIISKF